MARRKRDSNKGSGLIKNSDGLDFPFAAPPTRNPRYCVFLSYPHGNSVDQTRLIAMTFYGTYAAKHFLEAAIAGRPYKWLKPPNYLLTRVPDTILVDETLEIRCPGTGLEELIEYEFASTAEEEWELPDQIKRQIILVQREPGAAPEVDPETGETVKREKPRKEKKERKPKVDKTGLTTVGEIAEEMGIDAKDARAALRKSGTEKPDVGWAWKPDMVASIKKLIKANLKE